MFLSAMVCRGRYGESNFQLKYMHALPFLDNHSRGYHLYPWKHTVTSMYRICTTGHHTQSDLVRYARESPSLHNNPMPIHGNAFIILKYKGHEFESHKHVYHVARSIFTSWS